MRRRSRAGDKRLKARRKSATVKRRNAPNTTRNRAASTAGQETVVARITQERDEALLRETANAEILGLISRSPGNLELVFQSILENTTRIFNAKFGTLHLVEGDCFRRTAHYNTPPAYLELSSREPVFRCGPRTAFGRVAATKQLVHIADIAAEQVYAERDPVRVTAVEVLGARTLVAVPMLKGSELIGAIAIYRPEVRPFTDKQIELVQNFAAQAVIAIENARLLNELRESLGQQTATADVLRVISSSPGELQPVYDSMLQNAVRLCDAKFGNIYRWDGDALSLVATHNTPPALIEARRSSPLRPHPETLMGRIVATKALLHTADLAADQEYSERKPAITEAVELRGIRTLLAVPMLKEDDLIGVLTIYRQEVRPFTEKQIALVQNFAAQAVIAIENARLLNELRQRTVDLTESLEQQTATSEVLNVISSSPGELEPVFQAMLENATRICDARFATLYLRDGHVFRAVAATHDAPVAYIEARTKSEPPLQPSPDGLLGRVAITKDVE